MLPLNALLGLGLRGVAIHSFKVAAETPVPSQLQSLRSLAPGRGLNPCKRPQRSSRASLHRLGPGGRGWEGSAWRWRLAAPAAPSSDREARVFRSPHLLFSTSAPLIPPRLLCRENSHRGGAGKGGMSLAAEAPPTPSLLEEMDYSPFSYRGGSARSRRSPIALGCSLPWGALMTSRDFLPSAFANLSVCLSGPQALGFNPSLSLFHVCMCMWCVWSSIKNADLEVQLMISVKLPRKSVG